MPLAKIVHSFDQDAVALWNANFEEGLQVAKATGAKEVWSARGNMPTIHLMGGTIMGANSGDSVTNSYGRTHEIPNLLHRGARHLRDPRVHPTRPTRSWRFRCGAPNSWRRIGSTVAG